MNAVYHLGPRLEQAKRWGQETLAGGDLDNKQFNDYVAKRAAHQVFPASGHRLDPSCAEGRI